MFFLITKTGIKKCWDTGDPYMLEYQTVYDEILGTSFHRDGRINKSWVKARILSGEYDLRSQYWVNKS